MMIHAQYLGFVNEMFCVLEIKYLDLQGTIQWADHSNQEVYSTMCCSRFTVTERGNYVLLFALCITLLVYYHNLLLSSVPNFEDLT